MATYVCAFFLLPFPYYIWSRFIAGTLPSEVEWYSRGINHGPWRWEAPMALVLGSMLLLLASALAAFAMGLLRLLGTRWLPSATFIVTAVIALAFLYLQISFLYWTID